MKSAVIVFPGSNCDRDAQAALHRITGQAPAMVWHADSDLPDADLIVLPGGFSFGDYLRCGAMASQSPVMKEVVRAAGQGTPVLGICNGFQVMVESGLLPGALLRNAGLKFICKPVPLRVEATNSAFTRHYQPGQVVRIPIAHGEGNYFADAETLRRLNGEGQIAFRYCDDVGSVSDEANPNGSIENIAGIFDERRTVLGLMPHPERASDARHGGTDGTPIFTALVEALA